jgi:PAS domain S-box-containing protein
MLSERDSAQLFDRMPFAAIVRALETNLVVAVNREFERATGYRRDELVGRHPSEIGLYPNERDFEQKVTRLSQEGKLLEATIAIRTKRGEILEATYAAAIIPLDRAAFILAVFRELRPANS